MLENFFQFWKTVKWQGAHTQKLTKVPYLAKKQNKYFTLKKRPPCSGILLSSDDATPAPPIQSATTLTFISVFTPEVWNQCWVSKTLMSIIVHAAAVSTTTIFRESPFNLPLSWSSIIQPLTNHSNSTVLSFMLRAVSKCTAFDFSLQSVFFRWNLDFFYVFHLSLTPLLFIEVRQGAQRNVFSSSKDKHF